MSQRFVLAVIAIYAVRHHLTVALRKLQGTEEMPIYHDSNLGVEESGRAVVRDMDSYRQVLKLERLSG